MGKVMHKIGTYNKPFAFSMCGKALHLTGGKGSKHWEIVDCKHCLKHKDKRKRK